MRFLFKTLLVGACCAASFARATPAGGPAGSPGVLEQVKARGVVRCGSVERPGLAVPGASGRFSGLEVDVCRAIATAVLGSPDRIEYHTYETPRDFEAVREQRDDVMFLTGSEIAEQKLAGRVLPVAPVFVETHALMVPAASPARHLRDLAGETICFLAGSSAERSLEARFEALGKGWLRRAFSEDSEMDDAYRVQRCHAIAGEATRLAAVALDPGVNRLRSRILPEPLAAFPIMATTGTGDARWSAAVAWTVHTLISAERPETRWYAGGAAAMPLDLSELGLDRGWQERVIAAVGHYGEIFERNLGERSPLKLARGPNANQLEGGLLLSPFLD